MQTMIEIMGGGAPENKLLVGKKTGFTLAEVLITIGIIGVVAAMTMPALIGHYQKKVLQEQFKVAYSMFSQLLLKAESDLGSKPECYYWDVNPYGADKCVEYYDNGNCKKYELADGRPLPSDYNGKMNECKLLLNNILSNVQVIAKCEGNAYQKGCIPNYNGYDTVIKENNPNLSDYELNVATTGCSNFNKNELLNSRNAYVFKNGIIIIPFALNSSPVYAIDINGKKGPNKWGYDLFTFKIKSEVNKPLRIYEGGCMKPEKGGVSTKEMIENIYSRR